MPVRGFRLRSARAQPLAGLISDARRTVETRVEVTLSFESDGSGPRKKCPTSFVDLTHVLFLTAQMKKP